MGRDFTPPQRPNVRWCGDLTEIPTDEGRFYLAAILDLHSRRCVGFALGAHHDAALARAAFCVAIAVRGGSVAGLVFHTDQGGEFGKLRPDERRARLRDFTAGDLDVLCAPKVLDEGVDIPRADLAVVIAGSTSRRQMTQRMGRILRPKPDGRRAKEMVILYAEGTAEDLVDRRPRARDVPRYRNPRRRRRDCGPGDLRVPLE